MTIETIPAEDAPTTNAAHRVVINFPDEHNIGGMKIEVIGITAEQLAVAVFHLQRTGLQLADMMQMQARMSNDQIAEVAAKLQQEKAGKIVPVSRGRRES